ncbi:MAG: hypothetical protein QG657_4602, partial [Acidobacteriota bacterium]|nr:hypothetical protein [Acidobacteriota bacterium]
FFIDYCSGDFFFFNKKGCQVQVKLDMMLLFVPRAAGELDFVIQ